MAEVASQPPKGSPAGFGGSYSGPGAPKLPKFHAQQRGFGADSRTVAPSVYLASSRVLHVLAPEMPHGNARLHAMKAKVLVVDDDQEFVKLLEFNLEREGCEIYTATNAVQALHLARSTLPDVILLDLMLPDMDGFSVCEILHSQPSTREIPVIVLSGLDWSWANTRKNKARIAQYFKKPVELNSVVAGVRAATEQRQAFLKSWIAEQRD